MHMKENLDASMHLTMLLQTTAKRCPNLPPLPSPPPQKKAAWYGVRGSFVHLIFNSETKIENGCQFLIFQFFSSCVMDKQVS